LEIVRKHRHARRYEVFGPCRSWLCLATLAEFCQQAQAGHTGLDRRELEVCVFIYLSDALQAGDLYVVGAEEFADYRAQLLPWSECEPRMAAYCAALGIPERGVDFAAALKAELTSLAAKWMQVSPQTAN
jgi:hypothetical protein